MDLLKHPSTVLEAVNTILPLMGYLPVVSLDEPNSEVPKVLRLLALNKSLLLAGHRWWFQKIHRVVTRHSGVFRLGDNAVGFYADDPIQAVFWNKQLVHPETGNPSDIRGNTVSGWEVFDVEYEAMPHSAQLYVVASTVIMCASSTLSQSDLQVWQMTKDNAMLAMTQNQNDNTQPIDQHGWFAAQHILSVDSSFGGWDPVAGVYRVI